MFFDFLIYQKFKGGTLIKCLISMLSNLPETLHSLAKLKNNQVAKIWGLLTQKTKIWCNYMLSRRFGKYSFKIAKDRSVVCFA